MIYNEKRFSEIAFTKHIAKAEKCSQCGKPVIQVADHVKSNYHEFVFGTDYKELLKKFYSGLDYTNFLVYKNGNVKLNSFSLIHNKHDDSFFVPYYNTVQTNKELIEENNKVLLTAFVEYTAQQRKKIIDDIWYYYRDRISPEQEFGQTQKNEVDTSLQNALTCVDHDSYEITQTDNNTNIKKVKIDLKEVDDLLHPDIKKILKNKSISYNFLTDNVFLDHKKRLQAYIYNSYLDWISRTDSFPELSCNECVAKIKEKKIFKPKHNVDEMGNKPDTRMFRTRTNKQK